MSKIFQAVKLWAVASHMHITNGNSAEADKLDAIAKRLYQDGVVSLLSGFAVALYTLIGLALALIVLAFALRP